MRAGLVNFSLVVGSTIFCFLILETALRVAGYNPLRGQAGGRELILRKSDNPEMLYELTPNSRGIAWGAPVAINSHGFRDREYDLAKPDDFYRIGVIGDSITFGNNLEADETYSKHLENLFKEHRMAVQVLNFGVGGYDTAQEVAFLEEIGLKFDIDEVIVGYCMNDAGVVSLNLRYIQRATTYGSPIYNSRALQFLRLNLDRLEAKLYSSNIMTMNIAHEEDVDFQVDDFVKERMTWIKDYTSVNDKQVAHLDWYTDSQRVAKVLQAFDKLKALSDQYDFEVTVLIIPYVRSHIEAYGWAYEIIRYEAEQRGFYVVEVLEKFLREGVSTLQISQTDIVHPNALGHRLIGESLFEMFLEDPARGSLFRDESEKTQE